MLRKVDKLSKTPALQVSGSAAKSIKTNPGSGHELSESRWVFDPNLLPSYYSKWKEMHLLQLVTSSVRACGVIQQGTDQG